MAKFKYFEKTLDNSIVHALFTRIYGPRASHHLQIQEY